MVVNIYQYLRRNPFGGLKYLMLVKRKNSQTVHTQTDALQDFLIQVCKIQLELENNSLEKGHYLSLDIQFLIDYNSRIVMIWNNYSIACFFKWYKIFDENHKVQFIDLIYDKVPFIRAYKSCCLVSNEPSVYLDKDAKHLLQKCKFVFNILADVNIKLVYDSNETLIQDFNSILVMKIKKKSWRLINIKIQYLITFHRMCIKKYLLTCFS